MEDCIFCKIVRGEISCYKIYEDSNYLVFLDVFPSMRGQTLVVPKKHSKYLFDMEDSEYKELMMITKKISKAMNEVLNTVKIGMVVEGLEVEHVHIKLYPLFNKKPLDLTSKINISIDEMNKIAKKIGSNLR